MSSASRLTGRFDRIAIAKQKPIGSGTGCGSEIGMVDSQFPGSNIREPHGEPADPQIRITGASALCLGSRAQFKRFELSNELNTLQGCGELIAFPSLQRIDSKEIYSTGRAGAIRTTVMA